MDSTTITKALGTITALFVVNYAYRRYTSILSNAPTPKINNFWITWFGIVPPPSDGDDDVSQFLIESGQDQHQSPISVCFSIMGKPLVLVNTLKGIKDVLIDGQARNKKLGPCVQRGEMICRLHSLVFGGPSINNTVGQDWAWRRHVLLPPFQPRQLVPKLLPYVAEQVTDVLNLFDQHASQGTALELDNVFTDLTMGVINYYLYGRRDLKFDMVGGRSNLKHEHLKLGLGFQSLEAWLPFGLNKTNWAQRAYGPARERLKDFIRDSLNLAEEEHNQRQEIQGISTTSTYHCVAAAALDSGKYDHDREALVTDLLSLTFAGYDTTSHTLSFCFSELARHPELQQRLFKEVRQVLGPPPVAIESITAEKLAQLPLVTAMYRETLRKYPAVVFIPVHVNRDTLVDGVVVPGGAEIWCNVRGLQMNSAIFPDPDTFNIDRWLPPHSGSNSSFTSNYGDFDNLADNDNDDQASFGPESQHRFPDITFTLGQHACLGKNLAILELRTMIALTVNQFTCSLKPGNRIETKIILTTKPKNGVWVHFKKRID
ncbi:cytochrome P450 [Halteromyces radiatus]|uniref:cytochrome P450 n=1 Tax=Halteromyces radiatus TaxID=101107 RepID=UPI00221FAE6C|nr:cytochrome P450 [Halteromyces radiatus]KAI8092872.1 cytochrome P450 [Halteromyces radiatus]